MSAAAVGPGCTQCGAEPEIAAYLASISGLLDVDGDGQVEPLTDGILILRWLFGLRGTALVSGAVATGSCTRCSAEEIEGYLADLS